jgi:hypothetical protein
VRPCASTSIAPTPWSAVAIRAPPVGLAGARTGVTLPYGDDPPVVVAALLLVLLLPATATATTAATAITATMGMRRVGRFM